MEDTRDQADREAEELLPDSTLIELQYAIKHRPAVAAELRKRDERYRTMSTVEMMCENPNVDAHVREWEARCLKAEDQLAQAKAEIADIEAVLCKKENMLDRVLGDREALRIELAALKGSK